jgi:radical SAM superfamily enzyme YgiQ (UPF0313 family)
MRILLVLPAGEQVRVTQDCREVPKRAMLRFSVLPLTIVAALTPREHQVRILDENVEALDFDADVDVVGITFMTALAPRAYKIAQEFRARGKTVVGGGYHATLVPEEAAGHFDAIVAGDAEGVWEQVLLDVEAGRLRKIYSAGRTPLCMPGPPAAQSSNGRGELQVPVPRRELLSRTERFYVTIHAVQTGRGCNHGCRYCSVTAFHQRTYRHRPLESVLEELRAVPRDFIFVDDNIIASREYALELFRAMAPLRKRWVAQCSIEVADDPTLLGLMRAAGCCGLFIGVETVSEENLAAMDKGFNDSRQYRDRLHKIHQHGIGVVAGMMVGLDRDDPAVFERCLQFLQRNRMEAVQLNILTPLPGTPLFEEMKRAGRITDWDWSSYDFRHVVFRPAGMTAGQLQAGADWLYAQFYRLDRILLRFVRCAFSSGLLPAWLGLKLGLTYRYDNRREKLKGRNPALDDERVRPETAIPAVAG